MTSDEIIRMAREAGGDDWWLFREFMPEIERFAALVAAAEREKSRRAVLEEASEWGAIVSRAVEAEREACAKVCEAGGGFQDGYSCAAAIRARREQ